MAESLVFPPYLHSYGIRKATPKHLFMFFGPRTFFDDPQGLATTRLATWDDPKTEKDDDEVVVYGINSGRHQIIYNTSMYSLGLYGSKGSGKDKFLYPRGVAANETGDVYVADSGNNRIVRLFNPKADLQWRGTLNCISPQDKGLIGPSRVAIDEDGCVYVTDPGNKRIVVFNRIGKLILIIGKNQSMKFENGPTAIAVADGRARWSYYKGEKIIFCADNCGTRLWKFSSTGQVLGTVTMPKGYQASYGAIDFYHNYWVTDTKNHCIFKYNHDMMYLDRFGSFGEGDNQFVEPRGIAIYKRYGQVFIAEKKGAQYFWIGTSLKNAQLTSISSNQYSLTASATEYSFLSLIATSGKDTMYYLKKRMIYPGTDHVSFLMKSSLPGKVILKLEPTYSSYTYNAWYYPVTVVR